MEHSGLSVTVHMDMDSLWMVYAGELTAPVDMLVDDTRTDFPRLQFPPGGVEVLPLTSVTLMSDDSRRRGCAGNGHFPGDNSITVLGFPRASCTPGEMCTVELDFPRASFLQGESCAEELEYIRLASLTGSPVCTWIVTGSLLFGSPHIPVRGSSRSALLCLLRFDGLHGIPVSGRRTIVRQQGIHAHLLVTLNSSFSSDIITSILIVMKYGFLFGHDRLEFCQCGQYLIPPGHLAWIVLVVFYLYYCLARFYALHWTWSLINYMT